MKVCIPKKLDSMIRDILFILDCFRFWLYLKFFYKETRPTICKKCGHDIYWTGAIGLCWICFASYLDDEFIKERAKEIKPILRHTKGLNS